MGLRDLYSDNGADGDNVREQHTGKTSFDSRWNPVYCVYGWPHIVRAAGEKCLTCAADAPTSPSDA